MKEDEIVILNSIIDELRRFAEFLKNKKKQNKDK